MIFGVVIGLVFLDWDLERFFEIFNICVFILGDDGSYGFGLFECEVKSCRSVVVKDVDGEVF